MFNVGLVLLISLNGAPEAPIKGAGATLPAPLFERWVAQYPKAVKGGRLEYQALGSGEGLRLLSEGKVDFGASDLAMSDEELAKTPTVVHVPTAVATLGVIYSLPMVKELHLTGPLLADIFLGKVKTWNDPAIAKENSGVDLPKLPIHVVHRADSSGSTAIFTDYLTKVSPDWKATGTGLVVAWRTGDGVKGSDGMADEVGKTQGSIGYLEQSIAQKRGLKAALIKNRAGELVAPTVTGGTQAADWAQVPKDLRVSLTDSDTEGAYPLSAFTYLIFDPSKLSAAKLAGLLKFVSWATHDGQKAALELNYSPLPVGAVKVIDAHLQELAAQKPSK